MGGGPLGVEPVRKGPGVSQVMNLQCAWLRNGDPEFTPGQPGCRLRLLTVACAASSRVHTRDRD